MPGLARLGSTHIASLWQLTKQKTTIDFKATTTKRPMAVNRSRMRSLLLAIELSYRRQVDGIKCFFFFLFFFKNRVRDYHHTHFRFFCRFIRVSDIDFLFNSSRLTFVLFILFARPFCTSPSLSAYSIHFYDTYTRLIEFTYFGAKINGRRIQFDSFCLVFLSRTRCAMKKKKKRFGSGRFGLCRTFIPYNFR